MKQKIWTSSSSEFDFNPHAIRLGINAPAKTQVTIINNGQTSTHQIDALRILEFNDCDISRVKLSYPALNRSDKEYKSVLESMSFKGYKSSSTTVDSTILGIIYYIEKPAESTN